MKILAKVVITGALLLPTVFGVSSASAASTDDIVEYSKKFIGTPYVYAGGTPNGFDCSGYITYIYENFNVNDLPRRSADQYNFGEAVAKSELKPGDAVFFNTSGSGVSHAGIYIGDNNFIHASTSDGVRINGLDDKYWKNKYVGAKRYTNFDAPPPPPGEFRGLEQKAGQIGVVEIKKSINLWKRDSNDKLVLERVLNAGEKYRVYTYDDKHGGQYGLGDNMYITKMDTHIDYFSL